MTDSVGMLFGYLFVGIVVAFLVLVLGAAVLGAANFVLGLMGHPVGASLDRRRVRVKARIPARMRRAVLLRDGYRCQECGSTEELEMDHIIAESRGGATTVENLEVLCHDCNQRKGAQP